jgi:hypothetical protein
MRHIALTAIIASLISFTQVGAASSEDFGVGVARVIPDETRIDSAVRTAHSGEVLLEQQAISVESVRLLSPVTITRRSILGFRQTWMFEQGEVLFRVFSSNVADPIYCSTRVESRLGVRLCLTGSSPGTFDRALTSSISSEPHTPIAGGDLANWGELTAPAEYELIESAGQAASVSLAFQYLWGAGPRIGLTSLNNGEVAHPGFRYIPFSGRGPFPMVVDVAGARFEILGVQGHNMTYRILRGLPAGERIAIATTRPRVITVYMP